MEQQEESVQPITSMFSESEMKSLHHFREQYRKQVSQQAREVQRRLEFMQWLVATGKLSDHIR